MGYGRQAGSPQTFLVKIVLEKCFLVEFLLGKRALFKDG